MKLSVRYQSLSQVINSTDMGSEQVLPVSLERLDQVVSYN